jgi:hypothetical protein
MEIIDNFLDPKTATRIKNEMMSNSFPWYYNSVVTWENKIKDKEYYFIHYFYNQTSWKSDWSHSIVWPILEKIDFISLIRIKGNFYPRTDAMLENEIHKDYSFPHKGAIYYVNSNNGFTVFDDGTKVESIENRLLLFDPSQPHYSTHCTNQHGRVNINFNYF